jgi:hypothetical protein
VRLSEIWEWWWWENGGVDVVDLKELGRGLACPYQLRRQRKRTAAADGSTRLDISIFTTSLGSCRSVIPRSPVCGKAQPAVYPFSAVQHDGRYLIELVWSRKPHECGWCKRSELVYMRPLLCLYIGQVPVQGVE